MWAVRSHELSESIPRTISQETKMGIYKNHIKSQLEGGTSYSRSYQCDEMDIEDIQRFFDNGKASRN